MSIFLALSIALGVAFLLQIVFSMLQMKYFSSQFVKLRKHGKVAVGRKNGFFFAGAIVMFLIDEDGIILEGKKMEGVTCLARVKDFNLCDGAYIGDLTEEDGPEGHRNLRRAIADTANTYNRFEAGEILEDPPSPAKRLTALFTRKRLG